MALPNSEHTPVVLEKDAVIPLAVTQFNTSSPDSKFTDTDADPLAMLALSVSDTHNELVTATGAAFSTYAMAVSSRADSTGGCMFKTLSHTSFKYDPVLPATSTIVDATTDTV